VNLNDPSSALFGYGTLPTYYKTPPKMADGGAVPDGWQDPDTTDSANYGSDAHFYQPEAGGRGVQDLGNMGGASGDPYNATLPTLDMPDPSMGGDIKDWWDRYTKGDPRARSQAMLGVGGLGLLASLFRKRNTFKSPAQLAAGLKQPGGASPNTQFLMDRYFNAPASRYAPPASSMPGIVRTAGAGLTGFAEGGEVDFNPAEHGSHVSAGGGGGQGDRVPAMLSPGEYVWDADTVAALGDGDNASGAAALDAAREAIRAHKRSAPPTEIPPRAFSPLYYLKSGAK